MTASFDWIWIVAGWTLGGTGLLLALWALFWDRARGRNRCPGCWYDMTGAAALPDGGWRCPECGKISPREGRLRRTRRHWRVVVVSLLPLLAAYAAARTPDIKTSGWVGVIPTSALIWYVGRIEHSDSYNLNTLNLNPPPRYAAELGRRAMAGQLWGWQWRWLLGEVGVLKWRERWPAGHPFAIYAGAPQWLLGGRMLDIERRPAGIGYRAADPVLNWQLGVLPAEADRVDLMVSVGTWAGIWRLPIHQVARAEDAIEPVNGPEIDRAVKASLALKVFDSGLRKAGPDVYVGGWLYREENQLPEDIAIAVIVEFLRDGHPAGRQTLLLRDKLAGAVSDRRTVSLLSQRWNPLDPADMARWTVRVRGDAEAALADLQRNRYWAGEYTIPLSEVYENPYK